MEDIGRGSRGLSDTKHYRPVLSIRLLHMLFRMDILEPWYIPVEVPPIDGNFP